MLSNEERFEKQLSSSVGYFLDYAEDDLGTNYKVSYEIHNVSEMSARRMDDLLDSIRDDIDYYDMDEDYEVGDIAKTAKSKVEFTAVKGKRERGAELEIYYIFEEGAWKIWKMECTRL